MGLGETWPTATEGKGSGRMSVQERFFLMDEEQECAQKEKCRPVQRMTECVQWGNKNQSYTANQLGAVDCFRPTFLLRTFKFNPLRQNDNDNVHFNCNTTFRQAGKWMRVFAIVHLHRNTHICCTLSVESTMIKEKGGKNVLTQTFVFNDEDIRHYDKILGSG